MAKSLGRTLAEIFSPRSWAGASGERSGCSAGSSGFEALVRAGDPTAVISMLRDPALALGENDFSLILSRFSHHQSVQQALIERETLPPAIADRLLRLVEDGGLRERLLARHNLSSATEPVAIKASRHRPDWWSNHLRSHFR